MAVPVVPATGSGRGGGGARSARTRRRILDAAAWLLARRGYAGTRLADVAERAGVRAPALYHYFGSRDELVEEVVTTGMVDNLDHVRACLDAMPPDADALDRICCAVEAHLRVVLRISDYTIAAVRNTTQLPPTLRERHLVEQQRYNQLWRELVETARDRGELHPDLDPRMARMLILGALNWSCEWWSPGQGSLDSVVGTARVVVRRGLAAPTAPAPRPASAG